MAYAGKIIRLGIVDTDALTTIPVGRVVDGDARFFFCLRRQIPCFKHSPGNFSLETSIPQNPAVSVFGFGRKP